MSDEKTRKEIATDENEQYEQYLDKLTKKYFREYANKEGYHTHLDELVKIENEREVKKK